jgi:hypothetical protein
VSRLYCQHSFLGSPAAFALLPADFFNLGPLSSLLARPQLLDFIQQQPSCDESIKPLLARGLALHLEYPSDDAPTVRTLRSCSRFDLRAHPTERTFRSSSSFVHPKLAILGPSWSSFSTLTGKLLIASA